MTDAQLIMHIQAALNTEETGSALIEVARNAHKAEIEFASFKKKLAEAETDSELIDIALGVDND